MNSMPGAGGGAGGGGNGAGGYGGGPGGMGGGMMPGVGQGGAPVDHQQQQQMMMARQQQQMYMQQQAAARGGMFPPGMQQHPGMMQQQQNMYAMQQQQPGGGQPMDAAQMQRYQAAAAAARQKQQQQMQHMQHMQPPMNQQMLEQLRMLPAEERQARFQQHMAMQQGQQMPGAAAARGGYPPGMHPVAAGGPGAAGAHMNAMPGGHPQQQPQPGSSGMGMPAAAAAGPPGGPSGGGGMPSHFIKQEPLRGPGGGMDGGPAGMMGGHPNAAAHMMGVKQEPNMQVKQEPGPGASSMQHHPGMMQQQQHPGAAGAADGSPQPASMQHMQQQQQQPQPQPRMRQQQNAAKVRAAQLQQQQQQAAAAAAQGGVPPGGMVDPSMTVAQHAQQLVAAKAAHDERLRQHAAAGGAAHPHMQQMQQQHMDPAMMQHHRQQQQILYQQQMQQHHLQQQQQQQQQQQHQQHPQAMSMAMQARHQAAAAAAAAAGPASSIGSSMPPPTMQQQQQHLQQQQQAASPASVTSIPRPGSQAVTVVQEEIDEEEMKNFKKMADRLKEKYEKEVERLYKRGVIDQCQPVWISFCREVWNGSKKYSKEDMKKLRTLEKNIESYLMKNSVTNSIIQALNAIADKEEVDKEDAELGKQAPPPAVVAPGVSRIYPDPWPLDVRARRVRVPDFLSKHVRSERMDERLISRRKRHADAVEEEQLPLWSSRRMRHETDLDRELQQMERVEGPAVMNGKPCKIAPEKEALYPPVVNSVPKTEAAEQAIQRRLAGGGDPHPRPEETRVKLPSEAVKELNVLRWRLVTDDRLMFAETTNYVVAIAVGATAVPPLHVLIPREYPSQPATVLFEKSFPKSHPALRRLGEVVEARLATVPLALQGRVHSMAEVYKTTCESFFSSRNNSAARPAMVQQRDEQTPSPLSASSSTSTSPAEPSPPSSIPVHHLPTTYRPQPKFRPSVDGNAKSRMVY